MFVCHDNDNAYAPCTRECMRLYESGECKFACILFAVLLYCIDSASKTINQLFPLYAWASEVLPTLEIAERTKSATKPNSPAVMAGPAHLSRLSASAGASFEKPPCACHPLSTHQNCQSNCHRINALFISVRGLTTGLGERFHCRSLLALSPVQNCQRSSLQNVSHLRLLVRIHFKLVILSRQRKLPVPKKIDSS